MVKTYSFESKATPVIIQWGSLIVWPKMFIIPLIILHKLKVEESERIHQLVNCILLLKTDMVILSYEPTVLQIFEHCTDITVIWYTRCRNYFIAGQAYAFGSKSAYNLDIWVWISKQWSIQVIIFIMKVSIRIKEHIIDILCKTLAPVNKCPIEWNSTHNHIGFQNLTSAHA